MQCPFCLNSDLKVTDSRNVPEINAIKRRRECQDCSRRFTTFETVDVHLQVTKSDGSFEAFKQEKIIKGIEAACQQTGISYEKVKEIAFEVTREVMDEHSKRVSTAEIGELVIKHLKNLDPVAYIRFACVYRRFKDFPELMEAIETIKPKDEQSELSLSQ
jgi:transcriptional repressor NrdR